MIRNIVLWAALAIACGQATAGGLPPAAFADAAVPAPTVADEYDFIAATKCPCKGSYIPYDNFITYVGDVIVETIPTRCDLCRDERIFYFDLTPRFGVLHEFRTNKLASRVVAGPGDDDPCPSAESAVPVNSITEEYIFLETTAHNCGEHYTSAGQSLQNDGGHYYDVLAGKCPVHGVVADFYFNIDAVYGNMDAYPELVHMQRRGEPPAPLPGRTAATAFTGDAAARTAALKEAKHAADGGALRETNRYVWTDGDATYDVVETECALCGLPLRLYLRR